MTTDDVNLTVSDLGISVDAERAFSQCTLVLGKLRTRLSDETFRAILLLRSWHFAGLLPELGELAQCLRDADETKRKAESAAQSSAASARERRKRTRANTANTISSTERPSQKRAITNFIGSDSD